MKKWKCTIYCLLLILALILFIREYKNNIIPISLNIYQELFHKKSIEIGIYKIKIPHRWIVVKDDKNKRQIIISNIPSLLDRDFRPSFILIQNIKITQNNKYKFIMKNSQKINSFFCDYNDLTHMGECFSSKKSDNILYIFIKEYDKKLFFQFIEKVRLSFSSSSSS